MHLSFEQIEAAQDTPQLEIHIPEWGGIVTCCTLDGKQLEAFEAQAFDDNGQVTDGYRAKFVAACVLDGAGKLLFDTPAKVAVLASKCGGVLHRLYDTCRKHNRLTSADDAAKNFDPDPAVNSR